MIISVGCKKFNFNKLTMSYILVFFMIYFSSSYNATTINGIPGRISMAITMFIALCAFVFQKQGKKFVVGTRSLLLLLVLLSVNIISFIINRDTSFYYYIILWTFLISAYLFFASYDFETFTTIFVNIMFFLCIWSIITYLLVIISPSVFNVFPKKEIRNGIIYDTFFSVVYLSKSIPQNYGMFWEPGAFQGFINMALIFELFTKNKVNKKYIIVFLLSIVTNLSTAGFIITTIVLIAYILAANKVNVRSYKFMFILIISCLMALIIAYPNLPYYYQIIIFDKIRGLFMGDKAEGAYVSGSVRAAGIIEPLKAFLKNPIFGIGYINYNKLISPVKTATIVNWFALFGIIWGGLYTIFISSYMWIIKGKLFTKMLIILAIVLIITNEDYHRNTFFLTILFYGMDAFIHKIHSVNNYTYRIKSNSIQ